MKGVACNFLEIDFQSLAVVGLTINVDDITPHPCDYMVWTDASEPTVIMWRSDRTIWYFAPNANSAACETRKSLSRDAKHFGDNPSALIIPDHTVFFHFPHEQLIQDAYCNVPSIVGGTDVSSATFEK